MAALHLRARVPLELHAADLALRPTLRQHPRRPPDHPVHGRRRSPCCSGSRRSAGSRSRRRRALPLRGRPGRDPAGVHLRHAHCHLPRRRRRRSTTSQRSSYRGPRSPHHLVFAAAPTTAPTPARRSPSASAAASAPSGAGVGIGIIFGKVIESVTRQPEMRDEITVDPVAGLRAHRGVLLLRPRGGPARLLPLGRDARLTVIVAAEEAAAAASSSSPTSG